DRRDEFRRDCGYGALRLRARGIRVRGRLRYARRDRARVAIRWPRYARPSVTEHQRYAPSPRKLSAAPAATNHGVHDALRLPVGTAVFAHHVVLSAVARPIRPRRRHLRNAAQ